MQPVEDAENLSPNKFKQTPWLKTSEIPQLIEELVMKKLPAIWVSGYCDEQFVRMQIGRECL